MWQSLTLKFDKDQLYTLFYKLTNMSVASSEVVKSIISLHKVKNKDLYFLGNEHLGIHIHVLELEF